MRKISAVSLLLILFACGFGCATTQTANKTTPVTPPKTQLQIRELQTRTYDTDDIGMVMKAMVNVLQDDGFVIQNANADIGLITATKGMSVFDKDGYEKYVKCQDELATCFFIPLPHKIHDPSYAYVNASILANINVTKFGNQTRTRANFQQKARENPGSTLHRWISLKSGPIEDEQYYQEFFSKVDKGIFIQKEKL